MDSFKYYCLLLISFILYCMIPEGLSTHCPDVPNKVESTFIINDTCYHLVQNSNSPATRDYARSDCRSRKGDLLTIKNQLIQDAILTTVEQRSDSHTVLLGLVKQGNTWQWVDGDPVIYNKWATTTEAQTGNCGRLNVMEDGTWEVVNCGTSDWFPVYICEHNKRTEESSGGGDTSGNSGVSFNKKYSAFTMVSSIVSMTLVGLIQHCL